MSKYRVGKRLSSVRFSSVTGTHLQHCCMHSLGHDISLMIHVHVHMYCTYSRRNLLMILLQCNNAVCSVV